MSTPALLRFSSADRPEDVLLVNQNKDGHPTQVVPLLQRLVRACKKRDAAALARLYVDLATGDGQVGVFTLTELELRGADLDFDHRYELVIGPKDALVIDGGEYSGPLAAWGWDEESWTHTQRASSRPEPAGKKKKKKKNAAKSMTTKKKQKK